VSVLVDTPIWSYAYRRRKRNQQQQRFVDVFGDLIRRQEAWLIGPVRQEVLSGFSETRQFIELRALLRAFVDIELETADFEFAAELHNVCRRKGVQGSSTDLLLCAVALRRDAAVFTSDVDFRHYGRYTGVRLHSPPSR
jgi:predicted nucleic acid-binding protein